jgi:hypothetical protein
VTRRLFLSDLFVPPGQEALTHLTKLGRQQARFEIAFESRCEVRRNLSVARRLSQIATINLPILPEKLNSRILELLNEMDNNFSLARRLSRSKRSPPVAPPPQEALPHRSRNRGRVHVHHGPQRAAGLRADGQRRRARGRQTDQCQSAAGAVQSARGNEPAARWEAAAGGADREADREGGAGEAGAGDQGKGRGNMILSVMLCLVVN